MKTTEKLARVTGVPNEIEELRAALAKAEQERDALQANLTVLEGQGSINVTNLAQESGFVWHGLRGVWTAQNHQLKEFFTKACSYAAAIEAAHGIKEHP